jgi:hypothetical protein
MAPTCPGDAPRAPGAAAWPATDIAGNRTIGVLMASAVRLRKIAAACNDNVAVWKWRTGKVPRANFPMAKAALGLAQPSSIGPAGARDPANR